MPKIKIIPFFDPDCHTGFITCHCVFRYGKLIDVHWKSPYHNRIKKMNKNQLKRMKKRIWRHINETTHIPNSRA
jgi:hypothetical protein